MLDNSDSLFKSVDFIEKRFSEDKNYEQLEINDVPVEKHLNIFHKLRGYKASAFTTKAGEIIAFDTVATKTNPHKMGRFCCKMFNPPLAKTSVMCASTPGLFSLITEIRIDPSGRSGRLVAGKFTLFLMVPVFK